MIREEVKRVTDINEQSVEEFHFSLHHHHEY